MNKKSQAFELKTHFSLNCIKALQFLIYSLFLLLVIKVFNYFAQIKVFSMIFPFLPFWTCSIFLFILFLHFILFFSLGIKTLFNTKVSINFIKPFFVFYAVFIFLPVLASQLSYNEIVSLEKNELFFNSLPVLLNDVKQIPIYQYPSDAQRFIRMFRSFLGQKYIRKKKKFLRGIFIFVSRSLFFVSKTSFLILISMVAYFHFENSKNSNFQNLKRNEP